MLSRPAPMRPDWNPVIGVSIAAEPRCVREDGHRGPQSIRSQRRMMPRTSVAGAPHGPSCRRGMNAKLTQTLLPPQANECREAGALAIACRSCWIRSGQDFALAPTHCRRGDWPSVQASPVARSPNPCSHCSQLSDRAATAGCDLNFEVLDANIVNKPITVIT